MPGCSKEGGLFEQTRGGHDEGRWFSGFAHTHPIRSARGTPPLPPNAHNQPPRIASLVGRVKIPHKDTAVIADGD